jgi:hypothetical protein
VCDEGIVGVWMRLPRNMVQILLCSWSPLFGKQAKRKLRDPFGAGSVKQTPKIALQQTLRACTPQASLACHRSCLRFLCLSFFGNTKRLLCSFAQFSVQPYREHPYIQPERQANHCREGQYALPMTLQRT